MFLTDTFDFKLVSLAAHGSNFLELLSKILVVMILTKPRKETENFKSKHPLSGKENLNNFTIDELLARTVAVNELQLVFNGKTLTLFNREEILFSAPAFSGRALEDGSFDYSIERQKMTSTGPIPQGNYKIDPQAIQWWKKQSIIQRIAAPFKRGAWPGGRLKWGIARTWISPKGKAAFGRSGFAIHGSAEPGSGGCIDICERDVEFFNLIKQYHTIDCIPLTVDYQL